MPGTAGITMPSNISIPFPAHDESRVLVIYTGGTIGMLASPRGYVTYPNYLYDSLCSQTRFNDPLSSALPANSLSVEAYHTWSSGSPTPKVIDTPPSATPVEDGGTGSSSLGEPTGDSQESPTLEVTTDSGKKRLKTLLMPKTPDGRRVRYGILEYERLIDSSEVEMADYLQICRSIQQNYASFDAFVVLHGTDTMSYSSSALSFLLEDLGKTVIVTGAQIPLSILRNDAVENLLGALMLAGNYNIPEVSLYFNHTLWRGNRSIKRSSFDFDAFETPNFEPLATVGININVRWDLVIRPTARKELHVHTAMCENVAVLRLFPSITPASVRAFLAAPVQGIVLETFGAGNAPQKPALLQAFREAADRGVVIVNVSQCAKGTVASEIYATGRALAAAGIIGGRDMTTECALAKLSYLLSKPELSRQDVRVLIGRPLRGELTIPPSSRQFSPHSDDRLRSVMGQLQLLGRSSAAAPIIRIGELSALDSPLSPSGDAAISHPGVDDGSAIPVEDLERAEEVLLPISMASAAAKEDESLKLLLESVKRATETPHSSAGHNPYVTVDALNDQSNAFGHTPLHIAAFLGRDRNVDVLLDHGASVHLRDAQAHTPLFYAASEGHIVCVKALRKAGAHLADAEIGNGDVGISIKRATKQKNGAILDAWKECGLDFEKAAAAAVYLLEGE